MRCLLNALLLLSNVLILSALAEPKPQDQTWEQREPNLGQPPTRVNIGLLYQKNKDSYLRIVKLATEHVNNDKRILPWTQIKVIDRAVGNDPRDCIQKACDIIERGVSAIIFPGPSHLVTSVADIANELNIPIIAPTSTDPFMRNPVLRPLLLQVPPSDAHQSEAIAKVLQDFNWIYFSILTSYDSYGINGMLRLQQIASDRKWKILNTQHFVVPKIISTLNVTAELKVIQRSEARVIVLNCGPEAARYVLKLAQQEKFKNMTGAGYVWIVTDAVVGNTDLFFENGPETYYEGLIGTLPASRDGPLYSFFKTEYKSKNYPFQDLTPFSAMVFDSVLLFGRALHDYLKEGNPLIEQVITCFNRPSEGPIKWKHGPALFEKIKRVEMEGASRVFNFSEKGEPRNVKYSIENFYDEAFTSVGTFSQGDETIQWDNQEKKVFQYMGPTTVRPEYKPITLKGRTLRLGVNLEPPFISFNQTLADSGGCKGNDCYSGYCIDLVKKIAEELEFDYEFIRPRDGAWGVYNATNKTWTGLVKDLLEAEIDIASVHLSINSIRERHIDFSVPFMDVGLAVVVKAKIDSSNEYFFLSPFEAQVWYCVILTAFLVTIVVCVYNKVSPYGLYGRKMHALMTCSCTACHTNRVLSKHGSKSMVKYQEYECLVEEVDNYAEDRLELLNMNNSGWLVIASLLQQGPVEGAPYCMSGRVILSVWWFFMMILIAMYTANLAAFLTVTRMKVGIEKVEDLLNQKELEWGTVADTSPITLMQNSIKEEYQKVIQRQNPVTSAKEGFRRVSNGDYAFIYESALLEYNVQRMCNIVIAGEKFSKFGFAFGFPPNSPYLDLFNNILLGYRETNILDDMWSKWLGEPKNCDEQVESTESNSRLDMSSLSGLFNVIGMGLLFSVLCLVAEYAYACFEDVYGNEIADDMRPPDLYQALLRRLRYTWKDIKSHWFVLETFRRLKPRPDVEFTVSMADPSCITMEGMHAVEQDSNDEML